MRIVRMIALTSAAVITISALSAAAQENPKYAKNGVTFEYLSGWELTEKTAKDTDEISLSNADADAQITLIAVRKNIDSKEPLADARKRVVDPWLTSLIDNYSKVAKLTFERTDIKTEAGGMPVDGVELKFQLDGRGGKVEACWVLFEKRLILLYMVRPDNTAEKADAGWEKIRNSLRVEVKGK